jgi:hypothetical protein
MFSPAGAVQAPEPTPVAAAAGLRGSWARGGFVVDERGVRPSEIDRAFEEWLEATRLLDRAVEDWLAAREAHEEAAKRYHRVAASFRRDSLARVNGCADRIPA